jgi:hypothetical protein
MPPAAGTRVAGIAAIRHGHAQLHRGRPYVHHGMRHKITARVAYIGICISALRMLEIAASLICWPDAGSRGVSDLLA